MGWVVRGKPKPQQPGLTFPQPFPALPSQELQGDGMGLVCPDLPVDPSSVPPVPPWGPSHGIKSFRSCSSVDPPWATAPERAPGEFSRGCSFPWGISPCCRGCQGSVLPSGSPGAAGAQLLHGLLGESLPWLVPAGLVLTRVPPWSLPQQLHRDFHPSWEMLPRAGSSALALARLPWRQLEPKVTLGGGKGQDSSEWGGSTVERRDHK